MNNDNEEAKVQTSRELELKILHTQLLIPKRVSKGWLEKLSEKELAFFWRLFELEYILYNLRQAKIRVDLIENVAQERNINLIQTFRKYEEKLYEI